VTLRQPVDLLRQVDLWLSTFRWAAGDKNAPSRFGSALHRIDSAILDFCKFGGQRYFQQICIALGQAERELAITERFRDEKKLKPLAGLSQDWIKAADDGSQEFMLAQALASLDDAEGKIGPLRANLEPVDWKKRCRAWAEKDRSVVWNAGDLATNLANVLERRVMDGHRSGCKGLPLASHIVSSLDVIAAFLNGDLDDHRIEDLLWGLMLIEQKRGLNSGQSERREENTDRLIPRTYALLKLLFLPRPLVGKPSQGGIRWQLAHEGEVGIVIRPEPRILPLLRAGRVGEACRIAAQRLRVSGLPPIPGALPDARTRDDVWSEFTGDPRRGQRLAASLLIPIDPSSVNRLIQLVCREQLEFTT
jgi:CRISPR-associated protein Csx17